MPPIKLHLSFDDTNNPAMMSLAFSVTISGSHFFFFNTALAWSHTYLFISFSYSYLEGQPGQRTYGAFPAPSFQAKGLFPFPFALK